MNHKGTKFVKDISQTGAVAGSRQICHTVSI